MIYKTLHCKQWSTKHYTVNNDLQTLHCKQWSTKHYTVNNDLQNTTL